ncbi:hypothetical protein C2857_000350 [Epichloe festucae Fl1]|uniref:D-isomer specific 2-hydroxyacid dehydrogenase catalytic domain-containing protein n=1 Tax=Epichloe festucae (strain Fl1) TaxID=877507 RepID=A0A7S9KU05_EPIFF|nr:hypothetical protein C2857_000350 [Epichloe festucae Fl1]
MAEPYNTPIPGSTPRSGSPVSHPIHPLPLGHPNPHPHPHANNASTTASKPRILHLGDPIRFNKTTHDLLSLNYDIIRPPTPERQRRAFTQALQGRKWGDFEAIFRPSRHSGGEMDDWDDELIGLLPPSVKVFANAGAGFDGVNTRLLGERGIVYCNGGPACADSVADLAVADQGRAMLTCHNGGDTVEAHAGFEELSMRNVMAVLEGEEPSSAVNLAYLKKKKKKD